MTRFDFQMKFLVFQNKFLNHQITYSIKISTKSYRLKQSSNFKISYNFRYFKISTLKYDLFEFSLSMKVFDLYLIKSHKQIPIDPQLVLAKKHGHYASTRESSNQIQINFQVLQISS
jgi:hypothetical protein